MTKGNPLASILIIYFNFTIVNHLNIFLATFSAVSSLMLMFVYVFFMQDMRKTRMGKIACVVMLTSLAALQVGHYLFFSQETDLLASRIYCSLLAIIPPAFFFFGREVLFHNISYRWIDSLHALPILLSQFAPIQIVPVIAFTLGSGYTAWFTWKIYHIRHESRRFKFEMFFFGLFALMAISALILGLALPIINAAIFYVSYSGTIAIAVLLIVMALLIFPELLSDILLIAEFAYSNSKLHGVDIQHNKQRLESLMLEDKVYENESLNLSMVAENLGLSVHQLSELINTEYGYSFSRFVREHRVKAAKNLLLENLKTSVLAISMETGFKSQSNFYAAFKASTGVSPGKFRKINTN